MQIKKYQRPNQQLERTIAASDQTSQVAAIPLKQQKADVEQQALNVNRMRSTDAKVRNAGYKAEVQRHKQKRQRAKQTANPHVDAATVQDNQLVENVVNNAIEQEVAQQAERHNPYGFYRRSYDPSSPMYQGAYTGLTPEEAEDKMGFFANLGDAIGTTNARNDSNRSLAARMADQMLWNLDSRNPSGGLQGAASNPAIMTMGAAGATPQQLIKFLGFGEGFNHITYPFTGKTVGQHIGDWIPIVTGNVGDVVTTILSAPYVSRGYKTQLLPRWQQFKDYKFMLDSGVNNKEPLEMADVSMREAGYDSGTYPLSSNQMPGPNGEYVPTTGLDIKLTPADKSSIAKEFEWQPEQILDYAPIMTAPVQHKSLVSVHIPPMAAPGQRAITTGMQNFPKGTIIGEIRNIPPSVQALEANSRGKALLKILKNKEVPLYGSHVLPYSVDSYMRLLMQASRYPEKYALRYYDQPLSGFNNQGLKSHGIERYAGTEFAGHTLQPDVTQLDIINAAIRRMNPNARLAKEVDGQLRLPYPYLIIKRKGGKLIKRRN